MADPFSLASGAAGLISLAITTCNGLLTYYSSWRHRDETVTATCNHIQSLTSILQLLQDSLSQRNFDSSVTSEVGRSIASCRDGIQKLTQKLKKVQDSRVTAREFNDFTRRALYPFKESTLLKMRELVSDLRDNLNLAVNVLQTASLGQLQTSTGSLVDQATLQRQETQSESRQSERLAALQWLSHIPFAQQHRDVNRLQETCLWIFDQGEFSLWIDNPEKSILWLRGKPGSGKTTITSAVIDHIISNISRQDQALAFFYCNFDDERRNTAGSIFASLLRQLCTQNPDCPVTDVVMQHYRQDRSQAFSNGRLDLTETVKLLTEVLTHRSRFFLVVDGFDECAERERSTMLENLIQWSVKLQGRLKVFIASREEDDIAHRLRNEQTLSVDENKNSPDISRMIDHEISCAVESGRLLGGRVSDQLQRDIKICLLENAKGMFLWVKLQIDSICSGAVVESSVRALLNAMPKDLEWTYDRIATKIKAQEKAASLLAIRILTMLAFAIRPLVFTELKIAVQLFSDDLSFNEDLWSEEVIVKICHGMLILHGTPQELCFVHGSAGEYVRAFCDRFDPTLAPCVEEQANSCLAKICLRYITNCDFHNRVLQAIGSRGDLFQSRKKFSEVGSDAFIEELRHLIEEFESRVEDFKRISEQWPFLEYAGTNWCKHVDYSKGRVALREFPWTYNEESAIFKAWISLNSLEGGRVLTVTTEGADLDLEELVRFEPVNLAHVAAYAGLRHLCFQVLSMKPNSVRAAFAVACYQGHLRMVQDMVLKLQDRVIGPNASILEAAMRTSLTEHTVIVEELLSVQNRLGDPESPEFKLPATMVMIGGCLFGSIEHIRLAWLSLGSPSVVYIDLDWVITIVAMDSRSGNGGKPQDPRTEKLEVPKMIATINNLTSWSPFMIAALSDHQETIQYTVQEKLFGESATSEISFAFQICAFLGSSDTFRFLLSLPFDEIPTGPALTATILSGNIEFAEILLEDQETWTELVLVGNQIKTAIGLAATTEYLEMAQLLHAKGANWTTKDGIGRTALHWAADFGQEDMVNWLLTMASPEEVAIVDRRGDSALDIAVRHGHTSILEKLAQGLASSDLSLR